MKRFLLALVVWFLVAVVLWLVARLFASVPTGDGIMHNIASFLDATNVVIGLLAGIYFYFWGYRHTTWID